MLTVGTQELAHYLNFLTVDRYPDVVTQVCMHVSCTCYTCMRRSIVTPTSSLDAMYKVNPLGPIAPFGARAI